MNDKEDFLASIDKMPVDELIRYESAAIFIGRTVNVFGVLFLLLLLLYPTIWMIFACTFFVYLLSNIGVSVNQFLIVLRDKLDKRIR